MQKWNEFIDLIHSPDFLVTFSNYVEDHKRIYDHVKIKGEMFEEILYKSLITYSPGIEWNPGGHQVGYDIKFFDIGISCKCGSVKSNKLIISGSRTTLHKTIKEKIDFLNKNHYDVIVSFAENKKKYELYCLPLSFIEIGKPEDWTETEKAWVYENKKGRYRIAKSTSDQMWYSFFIETVVDKKILILDI